MCTILGIEETGRTGFDRVNTYTHIYKMSLIQCIMLFGSQISNYEIIVFGAKYAFRWRNN